MDDEKILSAFFEHLKDKNPDQAAAETYRQIGEDLLAEVYKDQTVDKPVWDMLLKMMRALSRLNFYISSDEELADTAASFGPQHFAELAMLFQAWRDTLEYLADNYEFLKSERVKEGFTPDKFRFFVKIMDKRIAGTAEEIMATGFMTVAQREFHMMAWAFRMVIRTAIGDEEYQKFSERFNENMTILQMHYLQVVAPPDPDKRPN